MGQTLPAEGVGLAHIENGVLDVGGVRVAVDVSWSSVGVYVRRSATDLAVVEVVVAFHDELEQEELDSQNAEAERYPLGEKAYWRSLMVGRYKYGQDSHPMTDDDFEQFWEEN